MRTVKALKNAVASLLAAVVVIVCGVLLQRTVVQQLGLEYAGLSSLFTNIISMLAVAELGVGVAIVSQLYEPLARRDTQKVRALLGYFKKAYRVIALVVLGLGLLLMPLLPFIVGKTTVSDNLYLVFLLFIAEAIASYLLAYKRSLLYADQKNYVVSLVHAGYYVLMSVVSIVVLLLTKNFLLYLGVRVVARVLESYMLNLVVSYRYPLLSREGGEVLDATTRQAIAQKVRGMFFHKLSAFVVLNTDAVVIAVFLGLSVVGLYSNYLLVVTALSTLVMALFSAVTASVGNLLVGTNPGKSYEVYKRLRLANFWVASVTAIGFGLSVNSFVSVWLGPQYVLAWPVVLVLSVNLYLSLYRSAVSVFKEAAGIFYQDRVVPVMELVTNLVFSLVLVQYFGLVGVFVGTLLSSLVVHLYGYPRYVYKPLFDRPYTHYYKELVFYSALASGAAVASSMVTAGLGMTAPLGAFVVSSVVAVCVPSLLYWLVFRGCDEFRYFKKLISSLLQKRM